MCAGGCGTTAPIRDGPETSLSPGEVRTPSHPSPHTTSSTSSTTSTSTSTTSKVWRGPVLGGSSVRLSLENYQHQENYQWTHHCTALEIFTVRENIIRNIPHNIYIGVVAGAPTMQYHTYLSSLLPRFNRLVINEAG